MVTQFAAAVLSSELKVRVMSLGQRDFAVGSALGMLISGY